MKGWLLVAGAVVALALLVSAAIGATALGWSDGRVTAVGALGLAAAAISGALWTEAAE